MRAQKGYRMKRELQEYVLTKQLPRLSALACGIFLRSRKKGLEKVQKVYMSASRTSGVF